MTDGVPFAPKISIIIPVYNGGNYVKEAIDSALAQTYENREILVVNDGSTDGGETERIALSYGEQIRYLSKPNGGVSSALNAGIRAMTGDYVSWLSHDDAYNPEKLAEQVRILAALDNKKTVIKCRTEYIDANSAPIPRRSRVRPGELDRVLLWDEALQYLFLREMFNGCTLLIHRDVFADCGMFDETLRFNQDGLMWISICLAGYPFYFDSYVGVKSRIHGGQLTRKRADLYHRDCEAMSHILIPRLLACEEKTERRLMTAYAKYNATHKNTAIVRRVLRECDRRTITPAERIAVRARMLWGQLRSVLRSIYYLVFRRIRIKGGSS